MASVRIRHQDRRDLPCVPSDVLLAMRRRGVAPARVVPAPPTRAGRITRLVAADLALLFGLGVAVGEPRPVLYTGGHAAARLRVHEGDVSRALRLLARHWLIEHAGSLQSVRQKREGPRFYRLGAAARIAT